jgi:hypothetical protein
MNESLLQKDFKTRDVQRMRNLITKKYGDKTTAQIGYTKQQTDYKEGDIWEENGKQWTIKNGIKQTITKFDQLKKSVMLPLVCPSCNKAISNHSLNKKMWPIHGKCFDCVVDMETKLKKEGKYEEYEKRMVLGGVKTYIKELEDLLLEISLNTGKESFVTEAGDIEEWQGGVMNSKKITEELKEYIEKLKTETDKHIY